MKQDIGPSFNPGALAAISGTLVRILDRQEDEDMDLWYLAEPLFSKDVFFSKGWYPLEMLHKIQGVRVAINDEEILTEAKNTDRLVNFVDGYCEGNHIKEPVINYMEPVI